MLTALLFSGINCLGYFLALRKGPFWALLIYANIYFNSPDPTINWWAGLLPFHQWSFLTTAVLLASMFLHKDKLSSRPLKTVKLIILFCFLTAFVSFTISVVPDSSRDFMIRMLSYTIVSVCIVKVLKSEDQMRAFLLWIIFLAANLSLSAYLNGKRVHGRLENIGSADSISSNLFGLLLAGIIPLLIPFLLRGKRYERLLCLLCLPFILNAFVLCNSRGAAVALVGGGVGAIIFIADNKLRKKMIIVGILFLSLFVYLADQEMITRLSTLIQTDEAISNDEHANTLSSGRIAIWGYGLQMAGEYPLGAGPGAFKELAKDYMPAEILTYHKKEGPGVRGAHNSYLLVMTEQGILGLVLWLVLCSSTLLLIYRSYIKLKKIIDADLFWFYCVFALGISFLSTLVGGLFTSRVYYEFFWWQIALAVVLFSLVDTLFNESIRQQGISEGEVAVTKGIYAQG